MLNPSPAYSTRTYRLRITDAGETLSCCTTVSTDEVEWALYGRYKIETRAAKKKTLEKQKIKKIEAVGELTVTKAAYGVLLVIGVV